MRVESSQPQGQPIKGKKPSLKQIQQAQEINTQADGVKQILNILQTLQAQKVSEASQKGKKA